MYNIPKFGLMKFNIEALRLHQLQANTFVTSHPNMVCAPFGEYRTQYVPKEP